MQKSVVIYFSATGKTRRAALKLADALDADIHEIVPAVPYTRSDLNWMNANSRSSVEMNSIFSRPEIASEKFDISSYNTIYLGFPIWWYVAPRIINTFLESYDFSNKTIVLFATSGGSPFGKTAEMLQDSVDSSCNIVEGMINGKKLNKDYFI